METIMLILCKSCASFKNWRKEQHEKLADQRCKCGGSYQRLDCFKEKCDYTQYAKCKGEGYCKKKKGGAN